jgi:uncharacterized membrane protein YfbV (UPF0208 family)
MIYDGIELTNIITLGLQGYRVLLERGNPPYGDASIDWLNEINNELKRRGKTKRHHL